MIAEADPGAGAPPVRHDRLARVRGMGPGATEALALCTVAIVGCGALGGATASVLARCGVGRLRLIDRDLVEERNLGDQCLFDEADARERRPKAEAAAAALVRFDGGLRVEPVVADLAAVNGKTLLEGVDAIVDAADNLATKYLLNDLSLALDVPWVYAGCAGARATVMAIVPHETHCLRCIWPEPPRREQVEDCASSGLLPGTAQIAGAIQATETLKILLGRTEELTNGPLAVDAWEARTRRLPVPPYRPDECLCPACGEGELRYLESTAIPATVLCGGDTVLVADAPHPPNWELVRRQLADRHRTSGDSDYVRFTADGLNVLLFSTGRALVHGTDDPVRARALVGREVAR